MLDQEGPSLRAEWGDRDGRAGSAMEMNALKAPGRLPQALFPAEIDGLS